MRRLMAAFLLLGTALLAAPHGNAATPAPLRFAIEPDYPPMEFRDPATNALTGFDVDLGTAIAAHLHRPVSWQETSFPQMLPSLDSGRVDAILSGMSDLATRHQAARFIDYLRSGPQFFILATHASQYPNETALCGRRVGASRRTSFPKEIAAWSATHCGNTPITVVGTDGSPDARLQLSQGRIDAAVQGGETLPYIMQQSPGTFALVGTPLAYQYTGLGVATGDTSLLTAVASALSAMLADGSYGRIAQKWHLTPYAIHKVTINAGQ